MGETKIKPEKKVDGGKEASRRGNGRAKEGITGRVIKALGSIFTSDWLSSVCLSATVLMLSIVLVVVSLKGRKGGL